MTTLLQRAVWNKTQEGKAGPEPAFPELHAMSLAVIWVFHVKRPAQKSHLKKSNLGLLYFTQSCDLYTKMGLFSSGVFTTPLTISVIGLVTILWTH